MDKNFGDHEVKTLPEVERFIELENAELEMISGGLRGNEDDDLRDLEIQR